VSRVSIPETLLTFVGAPAAIYAVVWLAAIGPSQLRAPARYRPGKPWDHAPAWFVPHGSAAEHADEHPAAPATTRTAPVGGASGEW
jgi:hypothetical protein